MGDNTEGLNKMAYSSMTMAEAEKRLGVRLKNVKAVSVKNMLEAGNYRSEGKDLTKEKVHENIVDYLVVEGYPEDDNPNFKESSLNDLVSATIIPVIASFIRRMGQTTIQLSREKVIVSEDEQAVLGASQ